MFKTMSTKYVIFVICHDLTPTIANSTIYLCYLCYSCSVKYWDTSNMEDGDPHRHLMKNFEMYTMIKNQIFNCIMSVSNGVL